MTPLFTADQFDHAKSRALLPLRCKQCETIYHKTKHAIQIALLNGKKVDYCSRRCAGHARVTTRHTFVCARCENPVIRTGSQLSSRRGKQANRHFCSLTCAAQFNNTHKTHGTRRSKLEKWLEEQLRVLRPNMEMHFNRKDAINGELDIYIPSLKLAFELNGIFHYEPIYGPEKLAKIQTNDGRKYQACLEHKIELCIIDTTHTTYFKPATAQRYLDLVLSVIDTKQRMPLIGVEPT